MNGDTPDQNAGPSRVITSSRVRCYNLGECGQNNRFRMSAFFLAAALGASVAVVQLSVGRGWRLLLFVPFFMAAFCAFQGIYRTCSVSASKGQRETEGGLEDIANPQEVEATRRTGQRVLSCSLLTSVAATVAFVLIP